MNLASPFRRQKLVSLLLLLFTAAFLLQGSVVFAQDTSLPPSQAPTVSVAPTTSSPTRAPEPRCSECCRCNKLGTKALRAEFAGKVKGTPQYKNAANKCLRVCKNRQKNKQFRLRPVLRTNQCRIFCKRAAVGTKRRIRQFCEEYEYCRKKPRTARPTQAPTLSLLPTAPVNDNIDDTPTQAPSISLLPTASTLPSQSPSLSSVPTPEITGFEYTPQPLKLRGDDDSGKCTTSDKCGLCEGDCGTNADCEEGLVCYIRDSNTSSTGSPVPGCTNDKDEWEAKDFCVDERLYKCQDQEFILTDEAGTVGCDWVNEDRNVRCKSYSLECRETCGYCREDTKIPTAFGMEAPSQTPR